MLLKTDFMHFNTIVSSIFLAFLSMNNTYANPIQCDAVQKTAVLKTLCGSNFDEQRSALNEAYLTAYLVTDAPIRLIEDTQQLWFKRIAQCTQRDCYQKQIDLRIEELNFYTSMNQSLTQHFLKYEHGQLLNPAVQLQVHQLSKDRIKIEGLAHRNPNNRADSQSISLLAYTSPDKKNEIIDNDRKCKYQLNFQKAYLIVKSQQKGCERFTGSYRVYD